MRQHQSALWFGLVFCAVAGCADEDAALPQGGAGADSGNTAEDAEYQAGAPATVPAPGDDTLELRLSAAEIAPGTESILCEYLETTTEDLWITKYTSYQQAGGHHLALFRALRPEPEGTVIDCSSNDSMVDTTNLFGAMQTTPDKVGTTAFPSGMALKIPAGTQLVAQSHYINASDEDISPVDVIHLKKLPESELADVTQVYTYASTTISFELPPGAVDHTEGFDCELPYPLTFISAMPHMHELGVKFAAQLGPRDQLETIIQIPAWTNEMRDRPEVIDFTAEGAPADGQREAGEVLRTFCTWRNDTEAAVKFPSEMCVTFGYFHSDAPEAADLVCLGEQAVDPSLMP